MHGSHRGSRSPFAPENTMYSYKKAVYESKTEVLEIDLHLCEDGHIVLHHDNYLSVNTDKKGYISSMTLKELK